MKCPECGAWSNVLSTRETDAGVRRRHECGNEHRFSSLQTVIPKKSDSRLREIASAPGAAVDVAKFYRVSVNSVYVYRRKFRSEKAESR